MNQAEQQAFDAMREALEKSLRSMEQVVRFRETGLGRPPEQTCMEEITAARQALTAAKAVSEGAQAQGSAEKLMRYCFELLESFEYEDYEDSQSKAFFKAHIDVDWFFYVKNSLERQLNANGIKGGDL